MKRPLAFGTLLLCAAATSSFGATGMINAGEVLLPVNVDAQYSAAIDPTTGYAYFGNSGADSVGYLSMINLHGPAPTLISSASESIPAGVYGLLGVTIDTTNADPAKHYLYVGTASGQVLKMSPGTATTPPQVLASITPTSNGHGGIVHGLMDASQHYAYFIGGGSTAVKVLRVDLTNFTDAGTVLIPMGESAAAGQMNSVRYGGIDTLNHYLYLTNTGVNAAHNLDNPDSPEICKINLQTAFKNSTGTSNPINGTDYSVLDLSSTTVGAGIARAGFKNPVFDEGIAIDAVNGCAYLGTYNCDNTNSALNLSTWPYNQSLVARIALGTPAIGASFPANPVANVLNLQVGERDLTVALLDAANGNVYFGTDNTYPAHVYMIHVGDGSAPMTEVGRLDLNPGTLNPYPPTGYVDGITHVNSNATQWGEIYLRAGVIDATHNRLYYGSDSTPGQVTQVNINEPAETAISSGTPTSTADTITWTTDETANSQVQYGTTTAYGSSSTLDPTPVTTHSVVLSGLTPGTLYHYRILSTDAAGNTTSSADQTFTTPAAVPAMSRWAPAVLVSALLILAVRRLPLSRASKHLTDAG